MRAPLRGKARQEAQNPRVLREMRRRPLPGADEELLRGLAQGAAIARPLRRRARWKKTDAGTETVFRTAELAAVVFLCEKR